MKLRSVACAGILLLAAAAVGAAPDGGTAAPAGTDSAMAPSTALTPMRSVPSIYPPIAAFHGVEGEVTLCFTVKPSGSFRKIHIEKTKFWTTNGKRPDPGAEHALEDTAIKTLKKWKFYPRRVDGKPVASPTCQTIRFTLHPAH